MLIDLKHLRLKWQACIILPCMFAAARADQVAGLNCRFVETTPLPAALAAHSAVTLNNGTVLVTGGYGKMFQRLPMVTKLARIYDPNTAAWRLTHGQLNTARFQHNAIRLPGGDVIIVGGVGQDKKPLNTIERFDPATEQFSLIGHMTVPRQDPGLNLLPGGRLLITGHSKTAEILEPDPNILSGYRLRLLPARTHTFHRDHATVTLKNGDVLLIGGRTTHIELFQSATETFAMTHTRLPGVYDDLAVTRLYDNKALIVGGQNIMSMKSTNKTWLYDIASNRLTAGPEYGSPENAHINGASDIQAVDLRGENDPDTGKYLFFCGGEYDPGRGGSDIILDSAYVYITKSQIFHSVGPMRRPHDEFSLASLPPRNGYARVLIIGGQAQNDTIQNTCEIFEIELSTLKDMP